MRNKIQILVIALLLSLSLAACGQLTTTEPISPAPAPALPTNTPIPSLPTTTPTPPIETDTAAAAASSADEPASGRAANADVTFVRASQQGNGAWTFNVTVAHPDTGWEDYADGWDVVLPDGTVLKPNADDPFTRLLLHPHETEQPFTRSQSNIAIPDAVTQVTVRAHDLVDGWGGQTVVVDLTQTEGPGFEVSR